MYKELGRLTQGYGEIGSTYHTEGTNTMRFLDLEGIKNIPRDRVVTYARIVVDYRAQTKDHRNRRGGNAVAAAEMMPPQPAADKPAPNDQQRTTSQPTPRHRQRKRRNDPQQRKRRNDCQAASGRGSKDAAHHVGTPKMPVSTSIFLSE